MQKIIPDYSSLSQPADHFGAVPFRRILFSTFGWLLLAIGVILVVLQIILPKIAPDNNPASWTFAIIAVGIVVLIVTAVAYGRDVARAERIYKVGRFAWTNGFDFIANLRTPNYPGSVFQQGNSQVIESAIILYDQKAWYEIGSYQYAIGYANAAQNFKYGYIRIQQQRQLPHVVLIGHKDADLRPLKSLMVDFKKQQNFELEGDFYKYFTVYAPHKYEADALYILTPDVMAALVDNAQDYDIEIIDNELYLYRTTPFDLSTEQDIAEALDICRIIGDEVDRQTDYYADQKIDDRSINEITNQGHRLRQRGDRLVVLYALYIIIYAAVLRNYHEVRSSGLVVVLFSLVGIIATLQERIRRPKATKKILDEHAAILTRYNK